MRQAAGSTCDVSVASSGLSRGARRRGWALFAFANRALDALASVRNQPWQSAAWVLSGAGAQCRCDQRAQAAWVPAEGRTVCPETTNVMFDGQVSARDLPRQQAGWCRIGARMRVPRPTGAMRPLWAIRARASQLGRSAPCTRGTTASDTRNLSSSKSCGSEPVRARSVRPQSMSTRRSAALSRRTCSPSRALQDCCGDHPQPMQTEAARARARSTTRAHCARSYQAKYRRRSYRKASPQSHTQSQVALSHQTAAEWDGTGSLRTMAAAAVAAVSSSRSPSAR